MSVEPRTILLIGATGLFGQYLAQDCATLDRVRLVLAARRAEPLIRLADRLDCSWKVLDRSQLQADDLREIAETGLVVDAAGPFQGDDGRLIEAAIEAGWDYIDLCDARDFMAALPRFDDKARQQGRCIISGASSTPCLSHAALDHLTAGWQRIDTLSVAICPGNKAPRGLSVMQAILGWVGQPLRMFDRGRWTTRHGWSGTRRIALPGLKPRLAALAETPDLDELVRRYNPTLRAEMLAGLEIGAMHHALSLAGWLRGHGLLPNLAQFARPARWLANLALGLGTDTGGMQVSATGQDGQGKPCRANWSLIARDGQGPHIPSLPAFALIRDWRADRLPPGAHSAAGLLQLDQLRPDFKRLALEQHTETDAIPLENPLFARAMGDEFTLMPAVTQRLHQPASAHVLHGECKVTGPTRRIGQLICRLLGFPHRSGTVPLTVTIEQNPDGSELWQRDFGGELMRSTLSRPDAKTGSVIESFGPTHTQLGLSGTRTGLTMTPLRQWIGPLPLPRFTLPKITAIESHSAPDRHHFEVEITLPVIGRLCRYKGWVRVP